MFGKQKNKVCLVCGKDGATHGLIYPNNTLIDLCVDCYKAEAKKLVVKIIESKLKVRDVSDV